MANLSNNKAVFANNFLQYIEFDRPVWYGMRYSRNKSNIIKEKQRPLTAEDIKKIGASRARRKIYYLVNANAGAWYDCNGRAYKPVVFSPTFRDNISDLDVAYSFFKKFILRMSVYFGDYLQYIAVPEYQKRGAVHYHIIIFNMPFTPYSVLEKLWSYGSCNTHLLKNPFAEAKYITKYLSKTFLDTSFDGKRRYYRSRALKEPIIKYGDSVVKDEIDSLEKKQIGDTYSFDSKHLGNVKTFDYLLYKPYSYAGIPAYTQSERSYNDIQNILDIVS
jgi:hypothetical protein